MKKEQIIQEIKTIIEDIADIPQEEIDASSAMMDEMDLSSLEVMAIVAEMEKKYKIRIPEKALRSFISLEDIAEYIVERA